MGRRLDLPSLAALALDGRIEHGPRAEVLILRGRLTAVATQRCVVTLDPVPVRLDVAIERYFVTGGEPEVDEILVSPDDEEPEPIEGDLLDLGEIAVEELSLALDPYPRAADAPAVGQITTDAADQAARSAFAALAALRDRSKRS